MGNAYQPMTPGVLGKKVYCTHWIRTGECDFMQQGCMFKHVIPDLATLLTLGYRSYPRWFREAPQEWQAQNSIDFDPTGLVPNMHKPWERSTPSHAGNSTPRMAVCIEHVPTRHLIEPYYGNQTPSAMALSAPPSPPMNPLSPPARAGFRFHRGGARASQGPYVGRGGFNGPRSVHAGLGQPYGQPFFPTYNHNTGPASIAESVQSSNLLGSPQFGPVGAGRAPSATSTQYYDVRSISQASTTGQDMRGYSTLRPVAHDYHQSCSPHGNRPIPHYNRPLYDGAPKVPGPNHTVRFVAPDTPPNGPEEPQTASSSVTSQTTPPIPTVGSIYTSNLKNREQPQTGHSEVYVKREPAAPVGSDASTEGGK